MKFETNLPVRAKMTFMEYVASGNPPIIRRRPNFVMTYCFEYNRVLMLNVQQNILTTVLTFPKIDITC